MLVKYNSLRDELLSVAELQVKEDMLNILKENYKQQIDSNRKLSYVKDLKALLKLLEKRDVLSFDNIQPLCYISSKFINDSGLQSKLGDYEVHLQGLVHSSVYNMYQDENVPHTASSSEQENINKTKLTDTIKNELSQPRMGQQILLKTSQSACYVPQKLDPCGHSAINVSSCLEREEKLQQLVLSRVSERLGRSWRDVARHLGILECQIDIIQNKHPFDLKEQSFEALKHCISQRSIDSWNLDLMCALENGRRKDLKEIVEELTLRKKFG